MRRSKRFLDPKVADRLTILKQSYTVHQDDISSTRNILFGAATSLSFIFLCRCLQRVVRDRQTSAVAAVEAFGLPYMYPTINIPIHTLQRLNNIIFFLNSLLYLK